MRILFFDPLQLDYVVESPRLKPLGGSQSGLCYLAEVLAGRGHEVALANRTSTPGRSRGVECVNIDQVPAARYGDFDIVVVMNLASSLMAAQIRSGMTEEAQLVLWSQHNADQAAMQELVEDPSSHAAWDWFIYVSEWQASAFWKGFGVDRERSVVLGNAVSPLFENMFADAGSIAAAKPWPPVLCYTSTPFRGLDVLLDAFPRIRQAIPGTRLRVYSSQKVYGIDLHADPYTALYQACREMDGVDYIGSLPQRELATALRDATVLAYPNTWAEGYCISVLEAMAAGCIVITSDLGALRHTTAGFGHLLAPNPDKKRHAEEYAAFAIRVLREFRASPAAQARLGQQVRHVNETGTWAVRAREWEAAFESMMGASQAGSATR